VLDGSSSMTQGIVEFGHRGFNTLDHLPVNRSYFQQLASSKRLCLHPSVHAETPGAVFFENKRECVCSTRTASQSPLCKIRCAI
jgi:hypothetical protein